jgi:hypothetical protein
MDKFLEEKIVAVYSRDKNPSDVMCYFSSDHEWLSWVFPRYICDKHEKPMHHEMIVGMFLYEMPDDMLEKQLRFSFFVDILRSASVSRSDLEIWLEGIMYVASETGLAGFVESVSLEFSVPKPQVKKLVFRAS